MAASYLALTPSLFVLTPNISTRADWLNFEWKTSVKWDGAMEIPDDNKYRRCANIIERDIIWE